LYGVVSYGVASRTREIGVRLAVGSSNRAILQMILRQALVLVLTGIAAGIGGSLFASKTIRPTLYKVSPLDPWLLTGACLLVIVAALCAAFVPAYRATKVNVMSAIHSE
jgi:putative ABC transport system permease protein